MNKDRHRVSSFGYSEHSNDRHFSCGRSDDASLRLVGILAQRLSTSHIHIQPLKIQVLTVIFHLIGRTNPSLSHSLCNVPKSIGDGIDWCFDFVRCLQFLLFVLHHIFWFRIIVFPTTSTTKALWAYTTRKF